MPFRTAQDVVEVAEPETFRQAGDQVSEAAPLLDPSYSGLTPQEAGDRRTKAIDMAVEIGIGAAAVERDMDRAAERIASKDEVLSPPSGVKPESGGFQWNFRAVPPEIIVRRNERDDAVLLGLREYLGPESQRGQADIDRAEKFFKLGRVPLPHERAEVSADMRAKFAALSDDDLKLVSNALLVQQLEVSGAVHEALARERKVRPVVEYLKSLPEPVEAAFTILHRGFDFFGIYDFASREIGIEKLWGLSGGEMTVNIEAANRIQAEKNAEDAVTLVRGLDITGRIAGTILEFVLVPDITSKIAAFGKLSTTAQRVISTSVRFGLRSALQLPAEGETIAERAVGIGISTVTGAALGVTGGRIADPFLRAGRVVGTTGAFMGLTAASGGDIEDIIETGVLVLGFAAFGTIRRGATGIRLRMERAKLARAIKAVRKHNPDLRGVPDESIAVVLNGYHQIQSWNNKFKQGKVTEDVAVARVNEILDRIAPVMRAIQRSVRTASKEGPQTAEEAVKAVITPALPPARPPAPTAERAEVAIIPPAPKETLSGAAIRLKSGELLTGTTHSNILRQVRSEGRTIENKEFDVPAGTGFVTNTGRFVSAEEGFEIAEKAGQLKLTGEDAMAQEFIDKKFLIAEGVEFTTPDIEARQDAQARAVEEIDALAEEHLRSIMGRDLPARGVLPDLVQQGPGGQVLPGAEKPTEGKVVAFHGTRAEIDTFKPLSHFGTEEAAKQALESVKGEGKAKVVSVELELKNPLEVTDVRHGEEVIWWGNDALEKGVITEVEFDPIEKLVTETGEIEQANKAFVKLLQSKGFDGLKYINKTEDEGSTSFVIFDPKQVDILTQPPSAEGLPALTDQGPIGFREESEFTPGDPTFLETPQEELDAIVDEVRINEGIVAASIVQELHDAGIETDSTHSTPEEIVVSVEERNLSPENRAILEAAGNITIEDSIVGILIRVAQPAESVLQTGTAERRQEVREITKANLETLDENVEKCPRCTNETLEAFGIREEEPMITGLDVKEAFENRGLELSPVPKDETGVQLNEFIAAHSDGSFYIMTSRHAMALIDGELTDFAEGTGRRKVVGAFEILAAPQRAGPEQRRLKDSKRRSLTTEATKAITEHPIYQSELSGIEDQIAQLPAQVYSVARSKDKIPGEVKDFIGKPGEPGHKSYLRAFITTLDENPNATGFDEAMDQIGRAGGGIDEFMELLDASVQLGRGTGVINEQVLDRAVASGDLSLELLAMKREMLQQGFEPEEINDTITQWAEENGIAAEDFQAELITVKEADHVREKLEISKRVEPTRKKVKGPKEAEKVALAKAKDLAFKRKAPVYLVEREDGRFSTLKSPPRSGPFKKITPPAPGELTGRVEEGIAEAPRAVKKSDRILKVEAELADLIAFEKEIKAKDGTPDEFPAEFKAKITKSLKAKKKVLDGVEAGEESRRVELVEQVESIVKDKGIPAVRAKEIFMEFGGQSAPELKTKNMTVDRLEAVIEQLEAERPKTIAGFTVITEKTEKKLETLLPTMIAAGSMTDEVYREILSDVLSQRRAQEARPAAQPKFIGAQSFITEQQGKEIIQRMLDKAVEVRQIATLQKAIAEREDIAPIAERLEERIEAIPARQPNRLQSMRYYLQRMQRVSGEEMYPMYEALRGTDAILSTERVDSWARIEAAAPDDFKRIAQDEDAQQRISDWIASKSFLKGRPSVPDDITEPEIAIARAFQKELQGWEIKARLGKFLIWRAAGKPLSGPEAMPQYERFADEIEKADDIYEGFGFDELMRYLPTQKWGVIGSGYEPWQVFSLKIQAHRMPETATGKGPVRVRDAIVYVKQEVSLFQRYERYQITMGSLSSMAPVISAFTAMVNRQLPHRVKGGAPTKGDFVKPKDIRASTESYINAVKKWGYPTSLLEELVGTIYASTAATFISANPKSVVRNLLQVPAFAKDRGMIFDPRNRAITDEEQKWFDTFVDNQQAILRDLLMSHVKGIPGTRFIVDFVRRHTRYPWSHSKNLRWAWGAKLNQVKRALKESDTIEEMMLRTKFEDMTLLEQRHALGILARDGEDMMARFVARVYSDNINVLYALSERAPGLMTTFGKIGSNLFLFTRHYTEQRIIEIAKIYEKEGGFDARWNALMGIFAVMVGGSLIGLGFKKVFGLFYNPYNPFDIVNEFEIGGLMKESWKRAENVWNALAGALRGDGEAMADFLTALPRAADAFIPFYDQAVRVVEATTETRGIDREIMGRVGIAAATATEIAKERAVEAVTGGRTYDRSAIEQIRISIDREYERRGGVDKIKRTALEKWQLVFGGAGIDVKLRDLGRQKKIMTAIKPGDFPGRGILGGAGRVEKAFIAKADKFYPELDGLRKDVRLGRLDSEGFLRKLRLESIASGLDKFADAIDKAAPPASAKLFEAADLLLSGAYPAPGKE